MKKIYIHDEQRLGKSPIDAAPLLLEQLTKLPSNIENVRMVLPRVWAWHEDKQWMRANMFSLVTLLTNAVGDKFEFCCEYNKAKELSVIASRH